MIFTEFGQYNLEGYYYCTLPLFNKEVWEMLLTGIGLQFQSEYYITNTSLQVGWRIQ